jgi:hypothetical protein
MATDAGTEHAVARGGQTDRPHPARGHHGNSPAAWTLVILVMVGSLVVSVGISVPSITIDVIGAVIIVLGLVVGKVMSLAGYGSAKPADPEVPHGVA